MTSTIKLRSRVNRKVHARFCSRVRESDLSNLVIIDMNGKSWRKIRSKGYVVMGKDETLVSTATLLFDNHGCYKYADIERDIESGEDEDEATANNTLRGVS